MSNIITLFVSLLFISEIFAMSFECESYHRELKVSGKVVSSQIIENISFEYEDQALDLSNVDIEVSRAEGMDLSFVMVKKDTKEIIFKLNHFTLNAYNNENKVGSLVFLNFSDAVSCNFKTEQVQ